MSTFANIFKYMIKLKDILGYISLGPDVLRTIAEHLDHRLYEASWKRQPHGCV